MKGKIRPENRKRALKPFGFKAPYWSEWRDLNPRPLGPEPSALPTALHPDAAKDIIRDGSGNVKSWLRIHILEAFFIGCKQTSEQVEEGAS
jgi:hypothetical protein